jgi:adenine-specific DNA-methyltransferase
MRRAEFALPQTSAAVKRHGKHYTPTLLATFLAQRVVSQLANQMGAIVDKSTVRVLDPACGDGELLFAVHRVAAQLMPDVDISLVGYDLDKAAIQVASQRAVELGVPVDWHQGDFLQARRDIPQGSFDAVITNPPYVRTQQLGQLAAQMLATEFGLAGRVDLTHPFVVLLPSLLRPEGVVGLLCSNRFLTTKSGANVRKVFQSSLDPVELYDLGDTKLFAAAVLPAIVIALNRKTQDSTICSFTSAYETESEATAGDELTLYDALITGSDDIVVHEGRAIAVRSGTLLRTTSIAEPWRLAHSAGDDWLHKVEAATWRTFGEVAKIRVGIKTTADKVFISDSWQSVEPKPEDELLLPLITHDNLTPWRISSHLATKVLYPYDLSNPKRTLVDMTKFPSAMSYFDAHAERLKGRKYVIEGGREWFEIWVPQKPSVWSTPKIVFPDISVEARFALDRSGAVVNGDCYWISLADVGGEDVAYLMLAVANSQLGVRFYDEVCGNKLYSGRRRWMTQYVARLPLPDPETDIAKELIRTTRELLGSGDSIDPGRLQLIDKLVEEAFANPIPERTDLPATLF